jgi:PEP-CTERM motif
MFIMFFCIGYAVQSEREGIIMLKKLVIGLSASIAASAITSPASAANIILRDTTGSFAAAGARGQAALFSFQKAANFWNRTLTNDVTINLEVSFASLAPFGGGLGSTATSGAVIFVDDVYAALRATGTTALDRIAVANLSPLNANGTLNFRTNAPLDPSVNGGFVGGGADPNRTFLDNNGTANNIFLDVNSANLKAIGIDQFGTFGSPTANRCSRAFFLADSCITLNSDVDFDFDPTDGINVGSFDATAVAIQEIGRALGFGSGVDSYDIVAGNPDLFSQIPLDDLALFSAFDLFRYGNGFDPVTGDRLLQLSANRPAFFSIDGNTPFNFGNSSVAEFANLSTGSFVGDGNRAGSFTDNVGFVDDTGLCFNSARSIGILDANLDPCVLGVITANDLAVLDAIGYNLNFDLLAQPGFRFDTAQVFGLAGLASVPEPETWAMMLVGFGFAGSVMRRRRVSVKVSYA